LHILLWKLPWQQPRRSTSVDATSSGCKSMSLHANLCRPRRVSLSRLYFKNQLVTTHQFMHHMYFVASAQANL
jgi:hypothetical protein